MPGKFPFAYLDGSWVPQQLGSKGQHHSPIRNLWQALSFCPGLDVLMSLLVATSEIPQRIAGSYQAAKGKYDSVFYSLPPVVFIILYFFLNPIFISHKILYFFHPLQKRQILQTTSCQSFRFCSYFLSALRTKRSCVSHFSAGRLVLSSVA